ncbi:MAG TPA: zinc ribbon domain-containing protein [Phycisphaerales bacterium]|nr:zinc ribbon domain-containing protein [Phycisphaerales bacterium]
MPTYEYRCKSCGHEFEQFQSMKDAALRKCPSCKKLALERLIGAGAAILFRGSGFYQTDYRSESYKQAAKSDAPAAKTESGGGEKPAKAETAKPAAEKPVGEKKKPAKAKAVPATD